MSDTVDPDRVSVVGEATRVPGARDRTVTLPGNVTGAVAVPDVTHVANIRS